jgi:hypothetical protein
MIEEGSTATAYEPYGVQPSPDYPSEIRSVKSKSDNLLPNTATTQTKNGITFTVNEDKTITVNGTATSKATIELNLEQRTFLTGAYTLSVLQNKVTGVSIGIKLGDNYYGADTSKTIALSEETTFYKWYIDVESGTTVNNLLLKPMFNKGDKALPYQPYGYVPVEAKVEGKNLFDKDNAPLIRGYTSGSTMTIVADTSVRMSYIKCKPNTTYTARKISGYLFTLSYSDVEPAIGTSFIERKIANTGTTVSITTSDNAKYLMIEYYKNDAELQPILDSIQIEEGVEATTYEPYKCKTISLPLGDIELRSTPDGTRDTFERVDGVWNYRGDITPFTITEDMVEGVNLTYHPNSPLAHVSLSSVGASKINYKSKICLMTNYKEQKPTGTEGEHGRFVTSASQNRLQILNKNITSLETAKTILAGETGIIKLDTPTYTPITDETLIKALDTLEQLILHKGYNRITVTSVNGVKAYLDLSMPSTASVTEVVETEASLDMPVVVVAGEGDVKPKVANQLTVNPSTGEAKINGEKVATEAYVNNLFQASETDLEAGVSTLETGKIYFVFE